MTSTADGSIPHPLLPVPTTAATSPYRGHIPALDGVRGVAVLMVLLNHFVGADLSTAGVHLYTVLRAIEDFGRLGVDLFFVLSGFLITGILLDRKGSPGYFRNFFARRVLRIFPLYYLALTIVFVIAPLCVGGVIPPWGHQAWAWFYATNIATTFFGTNFPHVFHFWSLAIEEHFYLVWPFVVVLTSRRTLGTVCLVLVIVALLSRVVLTRLGYPSYFFTLCRVDSLGMGALLSIVARESTARFVLLGLARWRVLGLAVLVAAVPYAILKAAHANLWTDTVRYLGAAVIFTLFVNLAMGGREKSITHRLLNGATLRLFGRYSYGLYVYHGILLHLLDSRLPSSLFIPYVGALWIAIAVKVVVDIAICLLVAIVSWHCFESPILSLKRFFDYAPEAPDGRRTATAAATP